MTYNPNKAVRVKDLISFAEYVKTDIENKLKRETWTFVLEDDTTYQKDVAIWDQAMLKRLSLQCDRIWANRLIGGTQVWEDIHEKRRKGVMEELKARVATGELERSGNEQNYC